MEGIHLDEQLCRQCGGKCCQGHPGVWSDPQRFFAIYAEGTVPPVNKLDKILHSKQLTLRDLGGVLIPAPVNTEHGCIAQLPDGCHFSTQERPCQCLALSPELETLLDDQIHCTLPPEFGSGTARENWRPFQNLLQQLTSRKAEG